MRKKGQLLGLPWPVVVGGGGALLVILYALTRGKVPSAAASAPTSIFLPNNSAGYVQSQAGNNLRNLSVQLQNAQRAQTRQMGQVGAQEIAALSAIQSQLGSQATTSQQAQAAQLANVRQQLLAQLEVVQSQSAATQSQLQTLAANYAQETANIGLLGQLNHFRTPTNAQIAQLTRQLYPSGVVGGT